MSGDGIATIPEWFAGKCVFITGASGFVGRVLLEKLLYSCPDLDKIYVLVRGKKGMTCQERIKDLFKRKVLFDRIKQKDVSLLDKVVGIEGDVAELGLGLSKDDRQLLQDKVSVFFHSAASVRFDQPLRDAILLNTRGTRETLELAKQMKKLESYVYVSTAFSNCDVDDIKEEIYHPKADWRKMITLAERYSQEYLETFSQKITGKFPNTYIYTKSLSENMVDEYKDALPAVVYRPSVVAASINEPAPGFIDKINSPGVILLGVSKGVLRVVLGDKPLNYIPVDTTVNGMIAVAWYKAVYAPKGEAPSETRFVFNATVVKAAPDLIEKHAYKLADENPSEWSLWYPFTIITSSWALFQILNIFLHIIPGLLIDGLLLLLKQKPTLMGINRRMFITIDHLKYFTSNDWTIRTDNFYYLQTILQPSDKITFEIHEGFDFDEYAINTSKIAKNIILNEPQIATKRAHVILKCLYVLHQVVKWGFIGYILKFVSQYIYQWYEIVFLY